MDATGITSLVTKEVFGVWFLIGAALVFFMQAGFAMVETGFTRAKNAGNIIMKNLMDFCIGTVAFVLLGYGLIRIMATGTAGTHGAQQRFRIVLRRDGLYIISG